jgi:Domain of unknown function (DUF4365)
MDENSQKEEFSYGYIHALASVCGYITHRSERQLDNRGIDFQIIGAELEDSDAPKILVQSKSTTWKYFKEGRDGYKYDLEVKNYNKLIKKSIDPTILIIVILPEDISNCLHVNENQQETLIKHCAYWTSLQGKPPSNNKDTVRIVIPKKQILTKEEFKEIMQKSENRRKRLLENDNN